MVTHGQQFRELCEPIFNATPINYVGLARLYNDGSRSYLISDPSWGEVLLKNNYHLAGTEDVLIDGPESSYQLWSISSMFSLNQQTQNLFKDCIDNNYGNGITLIERGKEFVEFFHICADSGYEKVDPYLIHNIDQLWNYVLYIRESLFHDKELQKAYEEKYHYEIALPNNRHLNHDKNLEIQPKKYYLGGNFNNAHFSRREMECLILLYHNKTTKETAKILGLSPRTVETYLENSKQKAAVNSKVELILELTKNNLFKSIVRNFIHNKRDKTP